VPRRDRRIRETERLNSASGEAVRKQENEMAKAEVTVAVEKAVHDALPTGDKQNADR